MKQTISRLFNNNNYLICIALLMIVYVVIEKMNIYTQFSVKYTDEDQCVFWLAADELMHGHFREPCFFGQDYNSCLEGWLAVPFLAIGMKFYEAIPLVTLLMSVIPFLTLSLFFLRRKEYLLSIVVLFCLLFFSLNYQLISVLPRGFVTGVFCFGIGYVLLLREKRFHFFWFSFFALWGFALNEITVFLIFPVLCIYFRKNYRSRQFYVQMFSGALVPLLYKVYAYVFYNIIHPEYNYFVKTKFLWQLNLFTNAFAHLDNWLFNDFTFIMICFITVIGLFIYQRQYLNSLIVLATLCLIFLLFGLERVQDGTESIMFNKSRLFLFIPFLLAVLFSLVLPTMKLAVNKQLFCAVILFGVVTTHSFSQDEKLETKILKEVASKEKVVAFLPVKDVYALSYKYIYICEATGNDLILYDGPRKEDFILYLTIPLLSHNKITTFSPSFDRRFWVFKPLLDKKPAKILVSGNFEDRYGREKLKNYDRRILIKENDWLVEYKLKKTIEQTCDEDFELPLRKH